MTTGQAQGPMEGLEQSSTACLHLTEDKKRSAVLEKSLKSPGRQQDENWFVWTLERRLLIVTLISGMTCKA